MARRHLNREQKRGLIQAQLKETPEVSDRRIAAGLGVSPTTAGNIRKEMEHNGQLSRLDSSIGADGKERPRQVQRKPVAIFNPKPREEKALKNSAVLEKLIDTQKGRLYIQNRPRAQIAALWAVSYP